MALSECVKCWDAPCTCGWDYRKHTKAERLELAAAVLGIPSDKLRELAEGAIPDKHPMDALTSNTQGAVQR